MSRGFVGINIEGVDELRAKLRLMSEQSRSDLVDGWVRGAAEIIADAAKAAAPVLQVADPRRVPGLLYAYIQSLRSRRNKPGNFTYRVGVPGNFPYKDPNFYPAYVEYGTKTMEAQPFMRPAFDTKWEAARDYIATQAKTWLESFHG